MKETGIIMSGSHPVDILEGRKTMTRRTRGLKEINECPYLWKWFGFDNSGRYSFRFKPGDRIINIRCPYGLIGDRLWVRETFWYHIGYLLKKQPIKPNLPVLYYEADRKGDDWFYQSGYYRKHSSLFMPRWASRITLEITEVRVERLQEITEADAILEGFTTYYEPKSYDEYKAGTIAQLPVPQFRKCWDSLNAKRSYGWQTNPFVWVIGFYRIKQGGDL